MASQNTLRLEGKINKTNSGQLVKDFATAALKNSINVGEAIINIFGAWGIAGFKFHCPETETITLQNDITTHYVENNSPIQDHIASRPVELTFTGFQGDYFYSLHKIESALSEVISGTALIISMLPKLDAYTQQVKASTNAFKKNISDAKTIKSKIGTGLQYLVANGVDLFKIFQNLYKLKSAQTRAFLFLEALQKSRLLFSVETSWKRYDNMAVQSLTCVRDNNADITGFTAKLMQIDFVSTKVSTKVKGRTRQQVQENINKGVNQGQQVEFI